MSSSGGVEIKQKQNGKTLQYISHVSPPPPRTPEVPWRARAQTSPLGRRVARKSQRRGAFWKLKTIVNELDPNFHLS